MAVDERVFLTIDIDWAGDAVIDYLLCSLADVGVTATWFATHATPMLESIAGMGHEIGIHPNFEQRLTGNDERTARRIFDSILAVAPEARAVRSHSLTQSSRLLAIFAECGLTHDCNSYLPFWVGVSVPPYRDCNGLIRVTHSWTDDLYVAGGLRHHAVEALSLSGPVIIDMHPIHYFLNTGTMDDYTKVRNHLDDTAKLRAEACHPFAPGARRAVDDLIASVSAGGRTWGTISQISATVSEGKI